MSTESSDSAVRELTKIVLALRDEVKALRKLVFEQNSLIKNLGVNTAITTSSASEGKQTPFLTLPSERPRREASARAKSAIVASNCPVRARKAASPLIHTNAAEVNANVANAASVLMSSASSSVAITPIVPTTPQYKDGGVNDVTEMLEEPAVQLRSQPAISPKQLLVETGAMSNSQPTADINWTEVRHKKSRQSLSLRCVAGPDVTSLKAAESRRHFHLWNMLSGADEIKVYLSGLCPQKAVTVEQLKTTNNYNSFKIGVPEDCYDKCFSVDVWPENARVKKWINYKKRTPTSPTSHGQPFRHGLGAQ